MHVHAKRQTGATCTHPVCVCGGCRGSGEERGLLDVRAYLIVLVEPHEVMLGNDGAEDAQPQQANVTRPNSLDFPDCTDTPNTRPVHAQP